MDLVTFLKKTFHEIYQKGLKKDLSMLHVAPIIRNEPSKARKQDLAQWVSLGLLNALIKKNIEASFRTYIQPLNKQVMVNKMDPSELFQHPIEAIQDSEEDDVQEEATKDQIQIQIEEILEEGIPSPLKASHPLKAPHPILCEHGR